MSIFNSALKGIDFLYRPDGLPQDIDASIRSYLEEHPSLYPKQEYAIYLYILYLIKIRRSGEIPHDSSLEGILKLLSSRIPDMDACARVADRLAASPFEPDFRLSVKRARQMYAQHDRMEFHQPEELTDLCVSLLDYKGDGFVSNPFAGNASYGFKLDIGPAYFGQEIDPDLWALTKMEGFLLGDSLEHYYCTDAFSAYPEKQRYIITTPPFEFFRHSAFPTVDVLSFLDSKLTDDGRAVIVVPSGFLSHPGKAEVSTRKRLTPFLSAIIHLPYPILNTSNLSLSVIVLDHNRKQDFVHVLDASELFFSAAGRKSLDVDRILKSLNEDSLKIGFDEFDDYCNWSPAYLYRIRHDHELILSGQQRVPMKSLLVRTSDTKIPVENFSVDGNSRFVKMESGKMVTLSGHAVSDELKRHSCLASAVPSIFVLRYRHAAVKAVYIEASHEHPVFYKSGLFYVFTFDPEMICPEYLVRQISNFQFDSTSTFLSINDLLSNYIFLPSLEEQERRVSELEDIEKKNLRQQEEVSKLIEDQKLEFRRILADKRHSIRNAFQPLMGRIMQEKMKISMDKAEVDRGYMLDFLLELKDLCTDFSNSLQENTKDIDQFGVPSPLAVLPFLQDFVAKRKDVAQYRTELFIDENSFPTDHSDLGKMTIGVNRVDMENLLNNILSNAVRHGFTDEFRNDYYFRISVSYDESSGRILFDFSNNGTRMSDNIDEKVYGTDLLALGRNRGDGHGGAYVKNFAFNYKGCFSIRNNYSDTLDITCIRLELPLYL